MKLSINDRISTLIDSLKSNPNAFAERVGVKATVIYNIIKGRRSKPSYELLQKIYGSFHALNVLWLIKGEGEMWLSEELNEDLVVQKKISLDLRVKELLSSIENNIEDETIFMELEELITSLTNENHEQKLKIVQLYDKQDQILDVFRKRLDLDI
ncbi:MAG: hypothetical protein RIA69_12105 [Cyclobacteriaceae bacterium]